MDKFKPGDRVKIMPDTGLVNPAFDYAIGYVSDAPSAPPRVWVRFDVNTLDPVYRDACRANDVAVPEGALELDPIHMDPTTIENYLNGRTEHPWESPTSPKS